MIVQTLGQLGCQNVTQFAMCQKAVDLLAEIRRQVIAQEKK